VRNTDSHAWGLTLPEMTSRRRYLVLAICCMSLFIVGMDATIVNVALPSIGRDSGRWTRTCW
jgi:hypothetical protein